MDRHLPCMICSETTHTPSHCPELTQPEKVSGGGGGHSHDDDNNEIITSQSLHNILTVYT